MDDAWDDVQAELCDVMLTAMVALATLTPDARETFNAHLGRVASRSLRGPGGGTGVIPRAWCRSSV